MGAPSIRSLFNIGADVLASVLDTATNIITVTLGNSTKGSPSNQPQAEWMQHVGFASLAAPPSSGGPSCQVVAISQGDRDVIIASKDPRACDRYANLKPGETMMHATVGQARAVCKADGSVTLYTTDTNDSSGAAVFLRIHPQDGLQFVAPWGSLKFDQTGLHVRHASGFRVDAGGVGLPGPLSSIGSYFNVIAGMTTLKSTLVQLGPGPFYNPVVFALAENPLTTPGIPLTAPGFGAPWGGFSSACVKISGAPGTG